MDLPTTSSEPINLAEWSVPARVSAVARLFTCGRPGRARFGRSRVPISEDVIHAWIAGLPRTTELHIVSLLGRKRDGCSEFWYYPFRSGKDSESKPSFQEWLDRKYGPRFVVHEFPTTDAQGIPPDMLEAAVGKLNQLIGQGKTVVVIDSAGAERTRTVCRTAGFTRNR